MNNMDYLEIQNFCGFDMDAAHEMAQVYKEAIEEALEDVGLEKMES